MNKKLLPIIALALLVGCQGRLEPGGPYAPTTNGVPVSQADYAFFVTDAAFDLAYNTVDAAFKFERDNRVILWKMSPNIKHALDDIRPKAAAITAEYLRLRAVYKSHPVPANLTALQSALAKMQQLAATAAAALPKAK